MIADLAKNLPLHAGFAVGFGLNPDAAVRMVTLNAAKILGVADRLGALEKGKLANVIVTTDHPGQATNIVKYEFINGKPVATASTRRRREVHDESPPRWKRPPPLIGPGRGRH